MKSLLPFSLALFLPLLSLLAETEEELIRKGDPYDQKFHPAEALKYYLPAEKLAPSDPDILKRIARQYRHLMTDASAKPEKLRLGHLSMDYALRAAAAAPEDSEAQLSPAISLGKMLPFLSTREQVTASPRIKEAADKALELDPRNDSAWHVLGHWNRVLADLSGVKRIVAGAIFGSLPTGSFAEAERDLQKAIAINPNRPIHFIELGRTYAQMGRKEDAKRALSHGLTMPNVEKDDAELKTIGREVLASLH